MRASCCGDPADSASVRSPSGVGGEAGIGGVMVAVDWWEQERMGRRHFQWEGRAIRAGDIGNSMEHGIEKPERAVVAVVVVPELVAARDIWDCCLTHFGSSHSLKFYCN